MPKAKIIARPAVKSTSLNHHDNSPIILLLSSHKPKALLATIQAATDVEPLVIGKPNPGMYQFALERMGTAPEETLVVGDRLETDIAGAQNLGSPCALVLSGVTSEEAAWEWEPSPDIIADNLTNVIRELKFLTQLDA